MHVASSVSWTGYSTITRDIMPRTIQLGVSHEF